MTAAARRAGLSPPDVRGSATAINITSAPASAISTLVLRPSGLCLQLTLDADARPQQRGERQPG